MGIDGNGRRSGSAVLAEIGICENHSGPDVR